MSTKRLFTLFVSLMLVGLVGACSPGASHVSGSSKPLTVVTRIPTRTREPVSIVKAYYSAVKMRDMDTALMYLANDVVLVETKPAPCLSEVVKGQQAVESVLKYSNVLSSVINDLQVDGDKVTYSVTKWLDPRIVGPNYPLPVNSHIIAVVEYGQIVSITETRDPEWVALRTRGSQDVACW